MNSSDDRYAVPEPEPLAPRASVWAIDRALLWGWIDDALAATKAARVDTVTLRLLCAVELEVHALAALIQAQASGIALEHLVYVRLTTAYADRYGRPAGAYDVGGLRRVAQALRRCFAANAVASGSVTTRRNGDVRTV